MTPDRYNAFLRSKIPQAEVCGFEPAGAPHESLFPHQSDVSRWAMRGGRRAVFANFGLGKTRIHLQIAKWVVAQTGRKFLIIAPLGVRQEFTQSDGPAMGLRIEYVTCNADVAAATSDILIIQRADAVRPRRQGHRGDRRSMITPMRQLPFEATLSVPIRRGRMRCPLLHLLALEYLLTKERPHGLQKELAYANGVSPQKLNAAIGRIAAAQTNHRTK